MRLDLMGKPGHAWDDAWVMHGCMGGDVAMMCAK